MSTNYETDANDNYLHDKNSYTEIGELHTDKDYALVGNIDGRYSSNKKRSILSPDSDRLIFNDYSFPDIKDMVIVKATATKTEKQVYIGKNILAIYDTNSGNFICENVKSLLKPLMNPIEDGGLNLSSSDLENVCSNLKYVSEIEGIVYIVSTKTDGKTIIFTLNPYTLEIGNFCPDLIANTFGTSIIYCKPFVLSTNLYFLIRSNNSIKCVYLNTYLNTVSEDTVIENGLSSIIDNTITTEKQLIAINNGTDEVFFFSTKNGANSRRYSLTNGFVGTSDENIFGFTFGSSDKFIQADYHYNNNDESSTSRTAAFIILTSNNYINFIAYSSGIANAISKKVIGTVVKGFYRSIVKNSSNSAGYGYVTNLICKNNENSDTFVYPIKNLTTLNNADINVSNFTDKNLLTETYKNVSLNGFNFDPNGSNIIFGHYEENGRYRPLIKDIGSDINITSATKVYNSDRTILRTGLESDRGVSLVKGIKYGKTRMTRILITPESLNEETPIILDENAEIFMKESNSPTDGKYTSGSFLWRTLAKSGIPYNTHIKTIGRIILDGKDIPIENVLITPPTDSNGVGNILLTIDKAFDVNNISDSFTKNGKSLYPGILFQNTTGFLDDALVSNVYNESGSFAYNDKDNGKLFDVGSTSITASCVFKYNDLVYLIAATNFGKIASINLLTGGYTKFNGESIGEEVPGFFLNMSKSDWLTIGNCIAIEQYADSIYAFFNNGSIRKASISNKTFNQLSDATSGINTLPHLGTNSVTTRYGDTVFVARNTANNKIYAFDLRTNKGLSSSINAFTASDTDIKAYVTCKDNVIFINGNNLVSYNRLIGKSTVLNVSASIFNRPRMVYDNNKRIYILDGNNTSNNFGYIDITDYSWHLLESKNVGSNANNVYGISHFFKNDNEYITVRSANVYYTYSVQNKTWSTTSDSDIIADLDKVSYSGVLSKMLVDNNVSYSIDTSNATIYSRLKVSDERGHAFSNVSVNFSEIAIDNILVSAIGFSNDGKTLIISYADGSIGSIFTPNLKYISPNNEETYVPISSVIYSITGLGSSKNLKQALAAINPVLSGHTFDHWSLTENGEAIPLDYLESCRTDCNVYAVFFDNIEHTMNRCVNYVFAKAGEFINEGATSITHSGKDVYINTPKRSLRWSEEIGCFFKGRDDKYTGRYTELGGKYNPSNNSVFPKPVFDCGLANCGKYIFYVNGHDKYAEYPVLTVHNAVYVYDTEYDEYSILYSGENNAKGTLRAKIKPFCYYFNGYLYSFGGLERMDDYTGTENLIQLRRTARIEEIDLISGSMREFASSFGIEQPIDSYKEIGVDESGNPITVPIYSKCGSKEIRHLTRFSDYTLRGFTSMFDAAENSAYSAKKEFKFNLITKEITNTNDTSNYLYRYYTSDNSIINISSDDQSIQYTFDDPLQVDPNSIYHNLDKNTNVNKFVIDGTFNKNELWNSIFTGSETYVRKALKINDNEFYLELDPIKLDENHYRYNHLIIKNGYVESKNIGKSNDDRIKSYVELNNNLYSLSIDTPNNDLKINVYYKSTDTLKTFDLDVKGSNAKLIGYDENILFIIYLDQTDNETKIIFYDTVTNTSVIKTPDGETSMLLYRDSSNILWSNYFKKIYCVINDSHLLCISGIEAKSFYDETVPNSVILKYTDDTSKSIYNMCIDKNHLFLIRHSTESDENLSDMFSVTLSNDGTILSDIFYINFNNYINSNINGDDFKIDYDVTLNKVIEYKYALPKMNIAYNCFNYEVNADNENDAFEKITSDNESVYYVNKTKIVKLNDSKCTTYDTDVFENLISDISSKNGVIYGLIESNNLTKLVCFNTEQLSIKAINIDYTISNDTKICIDDDNNVYLMSLISHKFIKINVLNKTITIYDSLINDVFDNDDTLYKLKYISDFNEVRIMLKRENIVKIYSYVIGNVNGINLIATNDVSDYIINFDNDGNVIGRSLTKELFLNVHSNSISERLTDDSNDKYTPLETESCGEDVYTLLTTIENKSYINRSKAKYSVSSSSIMNYVDIQNINNIFTFNNEIYRIGNEELSNDINIYKFDKNARIMKLYSASAINVTGISFTKDNIIATRAFSDGIVYIFALVNGLVNNTARLIEIAYNLKTKEIDRSKIITLDINGADALTNKVETAAVPSWNGKFFTEIFHIKGTNNFKSITINLLKMEVVNSSDNTEASALSVNGATYAFDGNFITVGGNLVDSSGIESSNPNISSEFSSLNGINGSTYRKNKDSSKHPESTIVKIGSAILIPDSVSTHTISKNGLSPYATNVYTSSNINSTEEDFALLADSKSNAVIPLYDNKVFIGSNSFGNTFKIPESPITTFDVNDYTIKIYSGSTKDIYISENVNTGEIIDKIEIERDYGYSVKDIKPIDNTRYLIIFDDVPNFGTLFVFDNGKLSIKNYNGKSFGQPINTGTNVHGIQEVDFTMLFDSEASESDFREVNYAD